MGQATSEGLQPRSLLAKNWLPMEKDANVLIHRITQEQIQRHYIRILAKDLPRQTALFSTRMANHHPHICRLLYFHPATQEQWALQESDRDFREMYIYTDRALPMRLWSRERVLTGLQGLRRLINVHGPIKITERMLSENEMGEVKVWISENPVNNHPDSKYMSEEQSMGDFAAILTKKNQELANFLIGCITLKQAQERLSKQREEHSPHQNYSHRASGSGDFKRRLEIKDKNMATPYKNVFGGPPEAAQGIQEGPITPKNVFKVPMQEKYAQSSFVPKQSDKSKPVSQVNNLSKYRDFLIPKRTLANEDKLANKSNPQLNLNDSSLEYRKREDYADFKPTHQYSKLNETSFDGIRKNPTENLSFTSSSKPFVFQHRFETVSNISSPSQNFASPKRKPQQNWNSNNEGSKIYSSECQNEQTKWQSGFKEERAKQGGGFDITIINNNVNNYISNITHNHITKADKGQKEEPKAAQTTQQFRNYSRMGDQNNSSVHSFNPLMKQSQKTKEKQYNIPIFLQQKKKTSMQWAEESAEINEKLKTTNLSRKNTVSSNPSYESPQFSSENNLDRILEDSNRPLERHQKSFNLTKNNESSVSTQKMTSFFNVGGVYPLTPTPLSSGYQGFTSFQKSQSNYQFKIPLRTKTMEFYQKGKGTHKNQELQNKSFTQADFEKSSNDIRPYNKKEVLISAHTQPQNVEQKQPQSTSIIDEPIKASKVEQQQQKPVEKKLEFKKQLRNQFKDLLGGDFKEKQQQSALTILPLGAIQEKMEGKQCKEGNLKQKIHRKKTAFAELKKEALKVLTDL